MNILVLNAGSSSLKFRVYRINSKHPLSDTEEVLMGGQIERIGEPDVQLTHSVGFWKIPRMRKTGATSVSDAAEVVLQLVSECAQSAVIDTVGHRIVHGGPRFFQPVRVDVKLVKFWLDKLSLWRVFADH